MLFTKINTLPINPPKIPIVKDPTKESRYGVLLLVVNLTLPELTTAIFEMSPVQSYFSILSTNVEILDAKNTFHVSENDQNVFGFDIS